MLTIDHLVKSYGSIRALDDISFHVEKGEIVGFLGPNGAGKSTCMNILTGYISSNSGVVKVGGVSILADPLSCKKQIGYLPEQPPIYPDMTVNEYLNFVYDLKSCTLNRKKHIEEVCEVVKIKDVANRLIGNLSKGYRQRVGIAQALINNPPIIIFDEPTVGLDPKQIIEIRNLIRNLGRDHTVILSTHILQEVQAVCDRIVIINKGKIVADELTENITRAVENNRRFNVKIVGPQKEVISMLKGMSGVVYAEQLAEKDGEAYTYTIESEYGIDIRKKLFYELSERHWPMIGLESLGMSLEDIFIAVVNKTDENKLRREKNPRRAKVSAKSAEINAADSIIRKTEDEKASSKSFVEDDDE